MIKEAINRILELARIEALTFGGRSYTSSPIHPVREPQPKTLEIHTLTGLVDYIKVHGDEDLKDAAYFLQVHSPAEVNLYSSTYGDFVQRDLFLSAQLPSGRGYPFGQYLPVEDFIIQLQAHFVQNATTDEILQMVSSIKDEAVRTAADDGHTQTVTARAGTALVSEVKVPNPVTLRPYRTFLEIEQPASSYVLRLKTGPQICLYEAGGGKWQLDAIAAIKNYLQAQAPDVPVIA